MNRGIARRTIFETRADVRMFLACLAASIRRGEIEVHSYSIMTTHYHLLVRSPQGTLSEAMRRVQNTYVRYFNRRRRRDGPLFRGRFKSKPVESLFYRKTLVRYIDQNAPDARLVTAPALYPYGSARHYASNSGPRWLSRTWIEQEVTKTLNLPAFTPAGYRQVFGGVLRPHEQDWIESILEHPKGRNGNLDFLDDLIGASSESVWNWMERKAKLADGTRPGLPLISSQTIRAHLDSTERLDLAVPKLRRGKPCDAWQVLSVWLFRNLASQSYSQIAAGLSIPEGSIARQLRQHPIYLLQSPTYQAVAIELTRTCLR